MKITIRILVLIFFESLPFVLNAQNIRLKNNVATVNNFQEKIINQQLYFSWYQLCDTIPGYYVLMKSNQDLNENKIVNTLEIVNSSINKNILVCMQDTYEQGFDFYILKKIDIPKELLSFKQELRLLSIADSLYFIKVIKD